MTGKWHVTNERKIDGYVTDNWPVQRGFDRYFGIIPGGANYFTPTVYSNNKRYQAPENFYLTSAISDTSARYIREHLSQSNDKPFFLYTAYTAPHWPLHADKETIEKYRQTYRAGWDKIRAERFKKQVRLGMFDSSAILSPRDSTISEWDSLTAGEQNEMAMRMAIYAAQIDLMDQGIGRILDVLKEKGALENTLIFFLSDNGACAEFISSGASKAVDGTAETFESYRLPWANVSSTPFREYKHFTHEGGIATPLIVHWPSGIPTKRNNKLVSDYGHITDIMATCIEVGGATYPETFRKHQIKPLEGKSLVPHFSGLENGRGNVYWEHEGNIALRSEKWKLVAKTPEKTAFTKNSIELFDVESDPTEMRELSNKFPTLADSLYQNWYEWAGKNGIFPIDTRPYGARAQAYRRSINGQFDDNLGGWNLKQEDPTKGFISIDTTSQLSGPKSALVTIIKNNFEKEQALAMLWPFRAEKEERFLVELTTKSNQKANFILRLESTETGSVQLIEADITAGTKESRHVFRSDAIPVAGTYRVALYFGNTVARSNIWIDQIVLKTL